MQPNDLKCCGNCIYRYSVDMGDNYEERCIKGRNKESHKMCTEWNFDGLYYIDRVK